MKDKWQTAISSIEHRVANQEQKAKEEKGRVQKILNQNRALKKALDAEKSKSIWQRLFGQAVVEFLQLQAYSASSHCHLPRQ